MVGLTVQQMNYATMFWEPRKVLEDKDIQEHAKEEFNYSSPLIVYDSEAKITSVVFRNEVTGETTNQYPAKEVIDRYKKSSLLYSPPIVGGFVSKDV